MPKYPLMECTVSMVGALGTELERTRLEGDRCVTPPELAILQAFHGDDRITEVRWVGNVEMDKELLRDDLYRRYGTDEDKAATISMIFPGGVMPTRAPDDVPFEGDDVAEAEAIKSEPEEDMAAAAQAGRMKMLRATYEKIVGKKPFGGWDEMTLLEKLAEATPAQPDEAQTEAA